MDNKNKNTPSSKKGIVITACLIAALVILNVLVGLLPYRYTHFDLTEDKEYTVTDKAKKYIKEFGRDTTVYVIDCDGSNPKFEYFMRRIGEVDKSLSVKFVSSSDSEVARLIKENNAQNSNLNYAIAAEGSHRSTFTTFGGMMAYYTEEEELISYLGANVLDAYTYNAYVKSLYEQIDELNDKGSDTSTADSYYNAMLNMELHFLGEDFICRMIEYVHMEILPARYYLTGHGETDMTKTELGKEIINICASESTPLTALDITAITEIPKDAASLTVFYPKSDFTEAQAAMLLDYLGRGGHITFITANENLSMPNLMSVINAYGLSSKGGIVGDTVTVKTEGRETTEKTVEIDAFVNTDHAALSKLKGAKLKPVMTEANAIDFANRDGLTLTPLITTAETAYIGENTAETAARSIAAVAEEKESGAKLLWYTGARSFLFEPISEDNELPDDELIKMYSNCFVISYSQYWIPFSYKSSVPVMEVKPFGTTLMTVTQSNFIWFTVATLSLTLIITTVGIIISYKRKKA